MAVNRIENSPHDLVFSEPAVKKVTDASATVEDAWNNGCVASLQAIWTADNGRLLPWNGDFHHDLITLRNLEKQGTDWWCGYSFSWMGNLYAWAHEGKDHP